MIFWLKLFEFHRKSAVYFESQDVISAVINFELTNKFIFNNLAHY